MENNNTNLLNSLADTGALRNEVRAMLQEEIQAALQAEMTAFMGYEKGDPLGWGTGNNRNGDYHRKIKTTFGELDVAVPRDRNGDFVQHTLPRYDRHASDVTELIVELYTHGNSDRDITEMLMRLYGDYYSPTTVSNITKALEKRAELFHKKKLTDPYPFIFMDATFLNLRRDSVGREGIHVILGITPDGRKEILDFAIFPTESASNYESMLMRLKERGLTGVLLGISDGLPGIEDMLHRVFPKAEHQSCWVHLQRNVMRYVRSKDRDIIADELKLVYGSKDEAEAKKALEDFLKRHERVYPKLRSLFNGKTNLFNFFHFPRSIRRSIYTTNLIESNNKSLKRKTKPKEQFPNEASLDRFVAIRYSEYNDKMADFAHAGFKLAECELLNLIDAKYPEAQMVS